MPSPRRVLVLPSWYPDPAHPTAGVFVQQHVIGLRQVCDVAVLYVGGSEGQRPPRFAVEDGIPTVRVGIASVRRRPGLLGRIWGVARRFYTGYFGYRRAGRAAFVELETRWGTPELIHVHALWPAALIARDLKRRYGIPYVVTEHSEEYLSASERRLVKTPGVLRFVLRPLAMDASRTIAVSAFLRDRLMGLGIAVDPVVIPNAVHVAAPVVRQVMAPHLIVHVSVMGPAKNLQGLLEAVGKLRERRRDFRLVLVGDGECRPQLERQAEVLGLGDHVEFAGRRSTEDVRQVIAESAFAVVSSTHETFSVVAAEALMCGRPVLSTRCGGPEEFITPDVGRLVDVGSVDALAEGLDWMLDHYTDYDPVSLHEYARERFAPSSVAAQVLAVYREVLDV